MNTMSTWKMAGREMDRCGMDEREMGGREMGRRKTLRPASTAGAAASTGIRRARPARIALALAAIAAVALSALGAGRALAAESGEAQRELFKQGAKLWPVYCAQCHNARPGSEFSPAQWNIIMMHMRTQANLPANDARALTEYLKRSH